jgi:hypothetical protein
MTNAQSATVKSAILWSIFILDAPDIARWYYTVWRVLLTRSCYSSGSTSVPNLRMIMRVKALSATISIVFLMLSSGGCGKKSEQPPKSAGAPPTVDSLQPTTGTGDEGVFTVAYTSSGGIGSLDGNQLLINSELKNENACSLYANYLGFYLFNDGGSALAGPAAPGSKLSNSQCTLDVGKSKIEGTGNTRSVTFHVTFNHSFSGPRKLFTYATTTGGENSGWQNKGMWIVP